MSTTSFPASPGTSPRQRALRAKERAEASRSLAALHHERAAEVQDSLGRPDLAERARQRAALALARGDPGIASPE
jgi:hypothetical protein